MNVRPLFPSLRSFGSAPFVSEDLGHIDFKETSKKEEDVYQRGFDDAKIEYEKRAEELRIRAEDDIERERKLVLADLGASISSGYLDAIDQAEKRLGDQVSIVLQELVSEALRRRALEDLAVHLRSFLLETTADQLMLSGPPELVSDLRDRLTGFHGVIKAEVSDTAEDVTASVGITSFQTRIKQWRRRLLQGIEGEE